MVYQLAFTSCNRPFHGYGDDVMGKCLLSIDWDYFIQIQKENWGSYIENKKNLMDLWYKRFLQAKAQGRNIQNSYRLSSGVDIFWEKIRRFFRFDKDVKAYVSDSHSLSYDIAANHGLRTVYLFDSHSDLGYGGTSSLNFEINCANWLGKLFKDNRIDEANIIYSPFTAEKPEYFKAMNSIYRIRYLSPDDLAAGIDVGAVHICRSGAWTPPWLDKRFEHFIKSSGLPFNITDCPARKWDTKNISLSDQINYLMA